MEEKIELKKTEIDQLTFRENLINNKINKVKSLEAEIQILKVEIGFLSREGSLYLRDLLQKYGKVDGDWERSGDFLTPVELKKVENA